jgi:NADPH-dependent ferric siderophore reductase
MAQSFYDLHVRSAQQISPSLHQLTLGGESLSSAPKGLAGGYCKLILEEGVAGRKALMRTYTVRAQRECELDFLFALHGGNAAGPATEWALNAKIGDTMRIRGFGAPKPLPKARDFYLIAGDMSALPAICANLEAMEEGAKGVCILEVQDEGDRIALDAPEGMTIQWIINPRAGQHSELLADALRAVERPKGALAAWAASEFSAMRSMRAFLRDELELGPQDLYISSYWKHGLNETEHKVVKREDTEAQPG